MRDLLQQCGLTTLDRAAEHYGLGLTIGNAEVRLLELANAYACLARLGQYKPYRMVPQASSQEDNPNSNPLPLKSRQVATPGSAYLIADILSDSGARALAFGVESPLQFEFPVACKTGTSSDFRDNWAFGYTPEFTVGVWVGNRVLVGVLVGKVAVTVGVFDDTGVTVTTGVFVGVALVGTLVGVLVDARVEVLVGVLVAVFVGV